MSLKALVEHNNSLNKLMGSGEDWTIPPTQAMAQQMFKRLDSNLSPEVIFQDGERRGAAAKKFQQQQLTAIKELKEMGFEPEGQMYNF